MKLLNIAASRWVATLVVLGTLCVEGTQAGILGPINADPAGVKRGAELLLVVWDPVAEVSYTKDLGLTTALYTAGDKFTDNFFVYAQQDTGYQKFFEPLNADVNFQQFRKASTNTANQVWGVYAFGSGGDGFNPADRRMYITLNSEWPGAGQNPEYAALAAMDGIQLDDRIGNSNLWLEQLNKGFDPVTGGLPINAFNTHFTDPNATWETYDVGANGSSFDIKGDSPYFGKALGPGMGFVAGDKVLTTNKIGNSSWFYYVSNASDDSNAKVVIDEFDNLKHDAYWGLAKDDKGDYILSFTMEAAVAKATSAIGQQRRNLTDFSALYGNARVLSAPVNEFVGWVPGGSVVNAVPEPSTYGLFALGLLMLGLRAKRQA